MEKPSTMVAEILQLLEDHRKFIVSKEEWFA